MEPTALRIKANLLYCFFWWWPVRVAVAPGSIDCKPRPGPLFRHSNPVVVIVHARLMPPPTMLRHSVELVNQRGYRAYLCGWKRDIETIRAALTDAGFVVRDRYAWTMPCGGPAWLPRRRGR